MRLAPMVFVGERWKAVFWIILAASVVLQVGFQLISRWIARRVVPDSTISG